jgi:hypothetical protein
MTGTFVAFSTDSTLEPYDTNGVEDVYTRLVSFDPAVQSFTNRQSATDDATESPHRSYNPTISRNGPTAIAFLHDGTDLGQASSVTSAGTQVVLSRIWNDMATLTPEGAASSGTAGHPALSSDGSSVAFDSDASDLVGADTNASRDVFVKSMPIEEGAPQQVTGVRAIPSSGHLTISWNPVPSGKSVDYLIRTWTQATGGSEIALGCITAVPTCVLDGLTDGQTVYVEVTAQNKRAAGPPSARLAAKPMAVAPEAPVDVTVSAPIRDTSINGDGMWAVDVGWAEPTTSPGVGFVARAFTAPVGGAMVASGGVGPDARTVSLSFAAGHTFYVEVVATNVIGESNASTPVAVTTPPVLPWAPLQPSAVAGSSSAVLSWHAALYNGGSAVTGYDVRYSSDGGATWTGGPSAFHSNVATTQTVTGLSAGVSYVFQVAALTSAGYGPYSESSNAVVPQASSATAVPGAPTNVSAVSINGAAVVSFTPPSDSGEAGPLSYTVRSSTGESATGSSSPIVIAVANGRLRTFTVTAVNSVGSSPPSAASGATGFLAATAITVATPAAVVAGSAVTVKGRLTGAGPVARVGVVLRISAAGHPGRDVRVITGSDGSFSYKIRLEYNTAVEARYAGSPLSAAASSGLRRTMVRVALRLTSPQAGFRTAHRRLIISGATGPNKPGALAVLFERVGARYVRLAAVPVSRAGRFNFVHTFTRGTHVIEVRMAATSTNAAGSSVPLAIHET